jgi:cardiolipin synthase A/B
VRQSAGSAGAGGLKERSVMAAPVILRGSVRTREQKNIESDATQEPSADDEGGEMNVSQAVAGALLVLLVHAGFAAWATGHALLSKNDPRSAFGWIIVCWVFPLAGPLLYVLFGINRVRSRARQLRSGLPVVREPSPPAVADDFAMQLTHIGDAVTQWSRIAGNAIEPLENGENAFPRMLAAIGAAKDSVWLATYIFETDPVGRQFVAALAAAVARGVQVRVLVDGIGEWYSWPHVVPLLRRSAVPAARFLAPRLLPPRIAINMRNHRKLLLVDGHTGFIGGMNIGGREVGRGSERRMADLHFQVRGPVLTQLARVFAIDWRFAAREELTIPPLAVAAGAAVCRVVTEGPDEDTDKLLYVILGAVSVARQQILIMTPYFIPQPELTSALQAAALRGVEVCLVLPEHSNLRYVDWASMRWWRPLLERGVRIYQQPAPFSHTKLLVVDGAYAQIGSANLDPRSLRLNFEIALEVYCADAARGLANYVLRARQGSREYLLAECARQSLGARIRNSLMWLLSAYL